MCRNPGGTWPRDRDVETHQRPHSLRASAYLSIRIHVHSSICLEVSCIKNTIDQNKCINIKANICGLQARLCCSCSLHQWSFFQNWIKCFFGYFDPNFFIVKIINFRGDLSNISAKKLHWSAHIHCGGRHKPASGNSHRSALKDSATASVLQLWIIQTGYSNQTFLGHMIMKMRVQ